ncbi:hypothetical protein [Deinococcus petrolearius]|uniref:DUF5666 domain-containing protein n=1 Tax=Deinococcus petrolearius TaxID=1751295 RepID=A0ABW1DH42_9DEIO
MKNVLMVLLTAGLLASCAPEADTDTTTDTTTTTTTTTPDTTATTDTTTTDTTTTDGTVDSTLANDDTANASEEADMAAGDGLEGAVMSFDGTARTFMLNEDDKNYTVNVDDATIYEGTATSADDFFGADRNDASVAVEGTITGDTITATKITTN